MKRLFTLVAASLLLTSASSRASAQDRPYTEGNVVTVSYIRIKPGMFDKYIKYLDTDYKRVLESEKKAGLVLDYAVYSSDQTHEGDWNMVLTVTYKNLAALDNLRDKTEPLALKATNMSSPEQSAQAAIERGAMRDQVGVRLLRQLVLK
jgi:hypothetical protein